MEKETIPNDIIRWSGIKANGFGHIPKAVMIDTDLTATAKCVYALFCSLAGSGNTAYPSIPTILAQLSLCKDAYHSALRLLTQDGYLSIVRERLKGGRPGFSRNIYVIEDFPKKYFNDLPEENRTSWEAIRANGIDALGYGTIPYAVMRDPEISSKAKAIYAYIAAFTGASASTELNIAIIIKHLGFSRPTYYQHIRTLQEKDYITVMQLYVAGRRAAKCRFTVVQSPTGKREKLSIKKQDIREQDIRDELSIKKQDISKQDLSKQDLSKQDLSKQDTIINSTTSNSINSNSITINSFNNLDGWIDFARARVKPNVLKAIHFKGEPIACAALDELLQGFAETMLSTKPRLMVDGKVFDTDAVKRNLMCLDENDARICVERYLAFADAVEYPKQYLTAILIKGTKGRAGTLKYEQMFYSTNEEAYTDEQRDELEAERYNARYGGYEKRTI